MHKAIGGDKWNQVEIYTPEQIIADDDLYKELCGRGSLGCSNAKVGFIELLNSNGFTNSRIDKELNLKKDFDLMVQNIVDKVKEEHGFEFLPYRVGAYLKDYLNSNF